MAPTPASTGVNVRTMGTKRASTMAFGPRREPWRNPRGRKVSARSTHQAEEPPDLVAERRRLLEGGEVAALVDLGEPPDVGEALLGPPPRQPDDLVREHGDAGRHRHLA